MQVLYSFFELIFALGILSNEFLDIRMVEADIAVVKTLARFGDSFHRIASSR